MSKFPALFTLTTALSITTLMFSLSVNAQNIQTAKNLSDQPQAQSELPLKDLRLFTLIFDHIRRSYVEPVSDQEILENAIKGMLQEMDPHSSYLNAQSFDQLQRSTQGRFSGVGIEIGSEGGFIKIISPIDGTPAAKAGLQSGDLIIKLNNESIRGLSLSEASNKMRGPTGTSVTFTIVRKGLEKPFDVTIVRDTIKSISVRHRIIDNHIGYLRISQFQSSTGNDFAKKLKQLRADNPKLKGLILDLRNNPGGILQASVQVVDALLDQGLIVYTKGRLANSNTSYEATTGDIAQGLPVVVLVNGGSASASEIVAGALQDQSRAIIMGTRTFGKGSVQTILPVGDKKGIKLTTALYFTPKGRSIQAQGIEPDILVNPAKITAIATGSRVGEADLGGHIKNANGGKDIQADDEAIKQTAENSNDNTRDNQLFEAINLIKGLAILGQAKTTPVIKSQPTTVTE